ncbi:hypothetical protein [Paraburkholderia sp. J67]|uniref:hypothetical protein n=1 Tax=Paraburkholderia sp. J67 TaxID=2805435 RepID=UPI002ABD1A7C|nr:hypothetical protein [Paraburkholderia sp. J67]
MTTDAAATREHKASHAPAASSGVLIVNGERGAREREAHMRAALVMANGFMSVNFDRRQSTFEIGRQMIRVGDVRVMRNRRRDIEACDKAIRTPVPGVRCVFLETSKRERRSSWPKSLKRCSLFFQRCRNVTIQAAIIKKYFNSTAAFLFESG